MTRDDEVARLEAALQRTAQQAIDAEAALRAETERADRAEAERDALRDGKAWHAETRLPGSNVTVGELTAAFPGLANIDPADICSKCDGKGYILSNGMIAKRHPCPTCSGEQGDT